MTRWPALTFVPAAALAILGWRRRRRALAALAVVTAWLGGLTWWSVSLGWAWAHHGLGLLVWSVLAIRELRGWVQSGGPSELRAQLDRDTRGGDVVGQEPW